MAAAAATLSPVTWAQCLCGAGTCVTFRCCPNSKNSIVTRIVYALILMVDTIIACIMLAPPVERKLKEIPGLCNVSEESNISGSAAVRCETFVGYKAVYRVSFGMSFTFLGLCLLTIKIKDSRDARAAIHNSFWFFKIMAVILLTVAAFYIPEGSFTQIWFWVGICGASGFIIIQLILLMDFAHSWNESWLQKKEEGNSNVWGCAIISAMLLCYVLSIAAVGLMLKLHSQTERCILNRFFIIFNTLLCFIVSIISILKKVQDHLHSSGLLPSSFFTLYTMYLTWSAITNEPERTCNPGLWSLFQEPNTSLSPGEPDPLAHPHFPWWDVQSIVGFIVFVSCILYSSIRSSTKTQMNKLMLGPSETIALQTCSGGVWLDDDSGVRRVKDNEREGVQYTYAYFHFILLLASLYIMMSLTNWQRPDDDLNSAISRRAPVWVKIISSWVCLLLYVMTLVAPAICPDRDFT